MSQRADLLDLSRLALASGEGRRLDLEPLVEPFVLGGERYEVALGDGGARLDISRTTHAGYALRLRFEAHVDGACMRCLTPASPVIAVDVREVHQPGDGDLESDYVEGDVLDLAAWVRDALGLALPDQVLCRPDCAGLCGICGADLNADPTHAHAPEPDPRWAKLSELDL
jgi:uncharacterized protein